MAWPAGPSGDDLPFEPDAARPGEDSPLAISVPDDASELAGEVAAYRRELRTRRRRERFDKWTLTRYWRPYGITGPVVIAALVVVVSVGGLFFALLPNTQPSDAEAQPLAIARQLAGQPGGLLLDDRVWVDGLSESAQALRPGVLALVPADCRCRAAVDHIASQAGEFSLVTYLVSPVDADPQMDALLRNAQRSAQGSRVAVYDPGGRLRTFYRATGVTILVVQSDGIVRAILRDVTPTTPFRAALTRAQQSGA